MQDGSIFLKEIVYIRLAYKSVFLDPSPSTTSMPGGGANEVDTTNDIEEDPPRRTNRRCRISSRFGQCRFVYCSCGHHFVRRRTKNNDWKH
mmetsp:Transcript_23907/g.24185  ORF Transcript_23907/g.24185 Transcript_23907/m.24185 type:complete len:91 (-) Transcript_23907:194-466(-)